MDAAPGESVAEPATPEGKGTKTASARPRVQRLFVDETKTTFFRRLSYSPDGRLLITPAGRYQEEGSPEQNTLYIFRTSMPGTPICRLNIDDQHTVVAVRCCPVVFKMREQGTATAPWASVHASCLLRQSHCTIAIVRLSLPCHRRRSRKNTHPAAEGEEQQPLFKDMTYRMVFAVVTTERVILYDTQQLAPFAMIAHLHYAPLSDVAW